MCGKNNSIDTVNSFLKVYCNRGRQSRARGYFTVPDISYFDLGGGNKFSVKILQGKPNRLLFANYILGNEF